MAKTPPSQCAPRKAAPAPVPATYPRPEIFWKEDESEPEPLAAPIATIRVREVDKSEARIDIDVTTPEALPNVRALLEQYGPGTFELVARSESGAILAKSVHRVKMPPGKVWRPPAPAAPEVEVVTPTQGPQQTDASAALMRAAIASNMDPFAMALLEHVLTLSTELAKSSQRSSADMLTAVSNLAGARIQDQQGLMETLLKMKPGVGADPAIIQKAYEAGMNKLAEMVGAAQEGAEQPTETDPIELLRTMFETFRDLKKQDEHGNVVPMQRKPNAG